MDVPFPNMTDDLVAWYEEFDRQERPGRVQRNARVLEWLEGYDMATHSGGEESRLALAEAKDAFIYGLPPASMFASHVSCERELAGLMAGLPDHVAPKGWMRWGLGRLIPEAVARGWISSELATELEWLSEIRRSIGHYRRPLHEDTLTFRYVSSLFLHGEDQDYAEVLLNDVGRALRAAFRLAYSHDKGFWR
jgi:hypothetical protein